MNGASVGVGAQRRWFDCKVMKNKTFVPSEAAHRSKLKAINLAANFTFFLHGAAKQRHAGSVVPPEARSSEIRVRSPVMMNVHPVQ